MKTITLLGVIAVSAGFHLAHHTKRDVPSPQLDELAARSGNSLIYSAGNVEGRDRETSIRFELSGRLIVVCVSEGDIVRQGATLARLESDEWKSELAIAEAALELAKAERSRLANGARPETREVAAAQVEVTRVDLERTRKTLARSNELTGVLSREDQDNDQAAFDAAGAELKVAVAQAVEVNAAARADELLIADAKIALQQAKIDEIKLRLAKTELRAPFDGTVVRVNTTPGELVGPRTIEPLFTMVDSSQLRVRAYVDELDALCVEPGMAACVTADGLLDEQFRGTVISCSPWMTRKVGTTHDAEERLDVKVREVIVLLEPRDSLAKLVIGLPVEVGFGAGCSQIEDIPSLASDAL